MSKRIDLSGKRFGKLTVKCYSHTGMYGKAWWLCDCDCGKKNIVILGESLKQGRTASCGCYRKENMTTHGKSNTRLFGIYSGILQRCYNPKCTIYKHYGKRGIRVCDEWLSENGFESFYKWSMTNGYLDSLTIDRIDVNKDYSPNNCRWITNSEQQYNKRNTRKFILDGENLTFKELSERTGTSIPALKSRIDRRKMTVEEAIAYEGRYIKQTHE